MDNDKNTENDKNINNNKNINNDEYNNKTELKKIPKYSVVLRFLNTPQEIEVEDFHYWEHKITKVLYIKFIDSQGRMWEDVPASDAIIITNFPSKEEIESFVKFKKANKQLEKELEESKNVHTDVSIC